MDTLDVILDEARRLLVRQETDLDTLRTRATAMLGTSGIIAGLFASRLIGDHPSGWRTGLTVAALVLFAASSLLSLNVQRPRTWLFSYDLAPRLDELKGGHIASHIDIAYNTAKWMDHARKENLRKLAALQRRFRWCTVAVALQVLCWGAAALA